MSVQSKAQTPGSTLLGRIERPTLILFACIFLLILLASFYSPRFLSPEYLLQQLKVAAFLGVIASGMMIVILLGHIDLSVPWVATSGAMMACATAAYGGGAATLAIPVGVACGAVAGLISGLS
jgi:ribose transport system permease protein